MAPALKCSPWLPITSASQPRLHLLDARGNHLDGIFAQRVHLAVEFQAEHAIAEIHQRRAGIALHHAARALEIAEHDHAGTRLQFAIRQAAPRSKYRVLGSPAAVRRFVERRSARRQHSLDVLGQRAAVLAHALGRVAETERVPGFERPELKRESPAHGAVDLDDAVGNLRNHLRRIEEEIAVEAPEELARRDPCRPPARAGAAADPRSPRTASAEGNFTFCAG